MKSLWGEGNTQFFYDLGPDQILDAVESVGLSPTGRVLALNSMENRVYEIELSRPIDDEHQGNFVVAKFYRPGRWTREQIQEEHDFTLELLEEEIPVCAPLKLNGQTIAELSAQKMMFTLFPKRGGRLNDELSDGQVEILGRLIARVHAVGRDKPAEHRLKLNPQTFGLNNLEFLLSANLMPAHIAKAYERIVRELCEAVQPLFDRYPIQRLHGDCHCGNLLWRDDKVNMVDFDDMVMGPVAQDLWPILPAGDEYSMRQRELLIDAYESMGAFDRGQVRLFTPLRALRSINYSTWIARRFEDPIFKQTFTWFGTEAYWSEQAAFLQDLLHQVREESGNSY